MARPRKSAQVRFQAKVRESDYHALGMATPCHEWLGATNAKDDPVFWFDHRTVRAQRVALMLGGAQIGRSSQVINLCTNRNCVNPLHLIVCGSKDAAVLNRSGGSGLYVGDICFMSAVILRGDATVGDVAALYGISTQLIDELVVRARHAEDADPSLPIEHVDVVGSGTA